LKKEAGKPIAKHPSGMVGFTIVWIGQLISGIATQMNGFGIALWSYQKTCNGTAFGSHPFCCSPPLQESC